MIKFYLVIVFTLPVFVSAETVYKTRDAEGNIIFSDVPTEGAEKIEIQEAQTLNIPKPKRIGERPTTKLTPEGINYSEFKIVSPENDTTIHSNEGVVNIVVEISPELDAKHKVVFFMNGKKVSEGKSLQFAINNIDRGSHNVMAKITDEKNKVIKQSNTVTIHLRKASKLFKNRTNNEANNPADVPASTTPIIPSL